jgi:hypothetical protein
MLLHNEETQHILSVKVPLCNDKKAVSLKRNSNMYAIMGDKQYVSKYLENEFKAKFGVLPENDINFTGFLDQDSTFYRKNNEFSLRGSTYAMRVPKSVGTENRYFKREEFIDGVNLTHPEELEQRGHNLQEIVATIAQNYVKQIERGHVHSDVHPGNFRVTDDKEIAILDRNYFLELTVGERLLLRNIATGSPKKRAKAMANYLASHNTAPITDEFRQELTDVFSQHQDVQYLRNMLHTIRRNNLALPLHMTLIAKNMMGLNSLAETAGFSLGDALVYKA